MIHHVSISPQLLIRKIKNREVAFAGNKKLKIYGALSCSSAKKMKKENRVFFSSEQEALNNRYRPCGHCMIDKYKIWKNLQ
jgi:methylphosphotriester-DNA--protein-cysteine methyltransferase